MEVEEAKGLDRLYSCDHNIHDTRTEEGNHQAKRARHTETRFLREA